MGFSRTANEDGFRQNGRSEYGPHTDRTRRANMTAHAELATRGGFERGASSEDARKRGKRHGNAEKRGSEPSAE